MSNCCTIFESGILTWDNLFERRRDSQFGSFYHALSKTNCWTASKVFRSWGNWGPSHVQAQVKNLSLYSLLSIKVLCSANALTYLSCCQALELKTVWFWHSYAWSKFGVLWVSRFDTRWCPNEQILHMYWCFGHTEVPNRLLQLRQWVDVSQIQPRFCTADLKLEMYHKFQ